jgi:hypothetical protein
MFWNFGKTLLSRIWQDISPGGGENSKSVKEFNRYNELTPLQGDR